LNAVRSIRLVWDGRVRIPSLPARPSGLPAIQRCVLDPQRQAAPPAHACSVGRPVLHLERPLRDVVTAVGVVFVRHRDNQNQRGEAILSPLDQPCAPTPFAALIRSSKIDDGAGIVPNVHSGLQRLQTTRPPGNRE
jgi:hypothetical protein